MTIENTASRDPLLHFAGSLGGPDRYITEMEAAGQSQLVNSTQLPAEGSDGYASLGIEITGPGGDDLFVNVKLPAGWSKQRTDHSMWSKVVDEHGRERVSVFYKAAFYDRRAHARVATVESYVSACVYDGQPIVTDEAWATRGAVRDAAVALAARYDEQAAEADEFGDRSNNDYWTGRAVKHRQSAAKFRRLVEQYA